MEMTSQDDEKPVTRGMLRAELQGNSCRDFSGAAGDTIQSDALTHADLNIGTSELHVLLFEFKK